MAGLGILKCNRCIGGDSQRCGPRLAENTGGNIDGNFLCRMLVDSADCLGINPGWNAAQTCAENAV